MTDPSKDEANGEVLKALVVLTSQVRELSTRFSAVETTQEKQGVTLRDLTDQVLSTKNLATETAAAVVTIAKSAAAASEIAAQAMARVTTAQDETTKMVQSAMVIQKEAVASAVRTVVAPLATDIEALKANDVAQASTLANQDTQLALAVALLSKLSRFREHWLVKVALVVGAFCAGLYGALHH